MTRRRLAAACLSLPFALLFPLALVSPVLGGNPISVHSVSGPLTWVDGVVPFNTDGGPLGILDNATATQIVRDGFTTWAGVPSAVIAPLDQGPILIDGVAADVTIENYMQVLFVLDGQSPVIYDHDGQIMDDLGVGDFAGFSFGEFVSGDGQHFLERAILLDGRDVDANGPFDAVEWRGLVTHEIGHHLGLGHSVVNGQAFVFGDPIIGLGPPPASSVETMYPFIDTVFQDTPHRDDISSLSVLYPSADFAATTGAIRGDIFAGDLVSLLRGANVTARNLADPYDDAVSAISGARQFFSDVFPLVTGSHTLDGLTPGASYSVALSNITAGGFSSPILNPLPGPDEFYNGAGESNDPDRDIPTELTPITPQAGVATGGINIIINTAAAVRILDDPNSLSPPDDAAVSGFAVPPELDISRVEARFEDRDGNGGQETLSVRLHVVGPLGAMNSKFRFQLDFGESQKVRRFTLSLKDQTVEPGMRGVTTADVTLELAFTHAGAVFSGLPSLAVGSSVDVGVGTIEFVAPVSEIFAAAAQGQLNAANNFDGTFTLLGFSSSDRGHGTDRVPDTNDNNDPSIVQETSRFTFFPFPVVPTHLASVPNGTLIAVEESTARAIRIGNIGINSFSGLAMSNDGRLFGSLGFTPGAGRMVEINPQTAQRTDVGFSGFSAVPGLDFAPPGTAFAGMLFGVGVINSEPFDPLNYFLVTIDTSTGQAMPVGGRIGVPFVDSIVFTDTGRLLAVGFVSGTGGVLAEIDPVTGLGSVIGPIGFAVAGLEVASDGSLLGSLGGQDSRPGGLIRIDPVTGAGTFIGFTGFSPVSGLTRLP